MFISPKPLASLSSGLLARKGAARPAMRPQAYATLSSVTPADDLGWNDMGGEPDRAPDMAPHMTDADLPPVLVELAALQDEMEQAPVIPALAPPIVVADPDPEPAPMNLDAASIAAVLQPRAAARGKAAFTLRLDAHRHLRLRLASAVTHRSSQSLMTSALDAFLHTLPEVEELASQCPSPTPMGAPR